MRNLDSNIMYTALAILAAVILFLFATWFGSINLIAMFSVTSIVVFLFIHIMTLGIDTWILSLPRNIRNTGCPLGTYYLLPLLFLAFMIAFEYFIGITNHLSPITMIAEISELNPSTIFYLIITASTLGAYAKIFSAFLLIARNKADRSNLLYASKALGLYIGLILLLFIKFEIVYFVTVLLSEFISFIVLGFFVNCEKLKFSSMPFDKKFIISAGNIFGFDAILKCDLLILTYLVSPKIVALYAIYSAVFEGYVQIFSSFRYKIAQFIKNNDLLSISRVLKICFFISLSFPICLIIFLIILGKFISLINFSLVLTLSMALFVSTPGIVLYNYFELTGRPIFLTYLAMVSLILNLTIGLLLFKYLGFVAVAIGTLVSFLVITLVNFYNWKAN